MVAPMRWIDISWAGLAGHLSITKIGRTIPRDVYIDRSDLSLVSCYPSLAISLQADINQV